MAILDATSLDADWGIFDGIRQVTLEIRIADDTYTTPQTIDALSLAADTKGMQSMLEAGVDGGKMYQPNSRIALRGSQVTGVVVPDSRITDWDGNVWFVKSADYKTSNTRVIVTLQS